MAFSHCQLQMISSSKESQNLVQVKNIVELTLTEGPQHDWDLDPGFYNLGPSTQAIEQSYYP